MLVNSDLRIPAVNYLHLLSALSPANCVQGINPVRGQQHGQPNTTVISAAADACTGLTWTLLMTTLY